jgi:ADP-ribose pyrophosphatase YjhB (NUDIX family)
MNIWRPSQTIKVKALGLHWRGDRLLVADVYNDDGAVKGVRPLGGSVEFGEDWRSTLIREFREELDVEITIEDSVRVMENIYIHHGQTGHEVLFIAEVSFDDSGFPDGFRFAEDTGAECWARWVSLSQLNTEKTPLFPKGLEAFLGGEAL